LGAASDLWLAIIAALARVVAFNMAAPLYDAYAMEQTEERARPFMIGLLGAAYSAGFLIAPLISTFVQERYGFGPLFVATAALYALSVLATWRFFDR
jgi:MFS family permease